MMSKRGLATHGQRPTGQQLAAAQGKKLPDVIAPDLEVLLCGINPSLYSAAVGHHFARPGNRFWPALFQAGITARQLRPDEQAELLDVGYGITNLVARATAQAAELSDAELKRGLAALRRKERRLRPRRIAFLGITAYRTAMARPAAGYGLQAETIGDAQLWVLPNPSGLNAHFQLADLARMLGELQQHILHNSGVLT